MHTPPHDVSDVSQPELLRMAAGAITDVLKSLNKAHNECPMCGRDTFSNFAEGKVAMMLSDFPRRLREAALRLEKGE